MEIFEKVAFTSGDDGGNPAGVVISDTPLLDEKMLSIAKDLGHSETVFTYKDQDNIWRVKYFAPDGEVDFCGHATVALGATLGEKLGVGVYNLQINKGMITVEAHEGGAATLVSPPASYKNIDSDLKSEILAAFNVSAGDIDDAVGVHMVNAGNDHILIPLKDRETLANKMEYDFDSVKDIMKANTIVTIALIFIEDINVVHIRNAFAFGGVVEDPATGAAAAAVSGFLRDTDRLDFDNGSSALVTYYQGDDMGQPSILKATIDQDPKVGISLYGTVRNMPKP